MQLQTIWQPSYKPPGFAVLPSRRDPDLSTKQALLNYLEQNGATQNRKIMRELGISEFQFRDAYQQMRDLVEHEQMGNNKTRTTVYWLRSNPPPVSARNGSYRVWHWLISNPWAQASEIPNDICTCGKLKHGTVAMLEASGKLISRKTAGQRKQYMAVV